jgi:hypothetical protein
MGKITFEGDPPYTLPVAQDASASAVDEAVEVTLRVDVPGNLPSPAPIRVQMTADVCPHPACSIAAGDNRGGSDGSETVVVPIHSRSGPS